MRGRRSRAVVTKAAGAKRKNVTPATPIGGAAGVTALGRASHGPNSTALHPGLRATPSAPSATPNHGSVGTPAAAPSTASTVRTSPTPSAPRAVSIPDATKAAPVAPASSLQSVRIGRLPPRASTDGRTAVRGGRSGGFAPVSVLATVPRYALAHESWKDADRAAARLGAALDTRTRKIVRALYEETAVLCTEPRTAGQDVPHLVAAELLPQLSLVVGPEVAPLAELCEKLTRAGRSCVLLDDARLDDKESGALRRIVAGEIRVVLTTPKWLARDAVLAALGAIGLSLVTVLEAQRVSPHSQEFSPEHARLRLILDRLSNPPVCAIAPGATGPVRHDVSDALFASPPEVFDGSPLRPNVAVTIRSGRGEVRHRAFVDAARALPRPLLVFCNTPRDVDAVHSALRALGLPAHRYHEEMPTGARAGEALQFSMTGEKRILVATSAFAPAPHGRDEEAEGVPLRFGRRVNKTQVRSLLRFQPPSSLEQLSNELALLGRDGQPAEAIVFHDPSDRPALEALVEAARPTGEQFLAFGRALESLQDGASVTTEALALEARTTRRTVETLAALLDRMGLVSCRDGWLKRLTPEHALLGELRALAERYATVRALDVRRIGDVSDLATSPGCRSLRLRTLLGEAGAAACGSCAACQGPEADRDDGLANGQRRPPARRFTVTAHGVADDVEARSFHSERRRTTVLTAKLGEFR